MSRKLSYCTMVALLLLTCLPWWSLCFFPNWCCHMEVLLGGLLVMFPPTALLGEVLVHFWICVFRSSLSMVFRQWTLVRRSLDHGSSNPGIENGQEMLNEKSKGLPEDKHLDLLRLNGPEIHKILRAREIHLCGIINLPTTVNLFGMVCKTFNHLSQHQKITFEDFQKTGHVICFKIV